MGPQVITVLKKPVTIPWLFYVFRAAFVTNIVIKFLLLVEIPHLLLLCETTFHFS